APFPTVDFGGQHRADFGAPAVFGQSALGPGALYYGSAPQRTFNGELDAPPVFSLQEATQSDSNVDDLWRFCANGADWVATAQGAQGPAAAGPSRIALDVRTSYFLSLDDPLIINAQAPYALARPSRYTRHDLEHVAIPRSTAQILTPDPTPERQSFLPVSGPSSADSHYFVGGVTPRPVQYETGRSFPTENRGSVGPVGWAPETETQLTQLMIPAEDTGEEYAPPDHPPPNYHELAIGSATPGRPDALSFIRCKDAAGRSLRAQRSRLQQRAPKRPVEPVIPWPATPMQRLQQVPSHSLDSSIYGQA
ncbi:hypothetical protein K488DRAFT_75441, partial [Vararia minispora EC-137]